MNSNHAALCPSPEWAQHLHEDILERLCDGVDLGDRLLEIGPGPGAATDWLRRRVRDLVAVEIDADAADKLRTRFAGGNVEIVTGDATALPYPDSSFDTVGAFTMLHHVPTRKLQDAILAEALRVLRPGGVLIASDSLPSTELHAWHVEDVFNPLDPATLVTRLQTIGFEFLRLEITRGWMVRATKPE